MAIHDKDEESLLRSVPMRKASSVMLARQNPAQEAAATLEALRQSNDHLHAVLDSITDGFVVVDVHWRITYLNAQAAELLGPHSSQDATGKALWQLYPDLMATPIETQLRHALAAQQSGDFELYFQPRQRWLEVRAYPSGAGLSCVFRDISQRKADERALRESADRLAAALAAGKLGDWLWDAASDRITLGPRAADILELPEHVPLSWGALRDRMSPEDWAQGRDSFLHAVKSRGDINIECRVLRRNGGRYWLSVVGQGNYGDDGALLGMAGRVQDITSRKETEDALRQSREELRALANSIPQLAWIAEGDGEMVWYNERWYAYTGTRPEEIKQTGWESLFDPECVPAMRQRWATARRLGEPFEMEFPIRGADGQFRWFLTRANPVRDSAGQVARWFGTSTDVDQVKRVQEALRDESNILELLNSTGSALASTRDLRPLLQEVTDAATHISGARFGAFFYNSTSSDGVALSLFTLSGLPESAFEDFPLQRISALFAPGMRGDGPLRSDDLPSDPRYATDSPLAGIPNDHPPMRSFLAVPVMSRSGDVIGSLFFGHPEPNMFNARTERIVGGIAAQAGVAIDNSHLYKAAQEAAEERKVLLDSERQARAEAERTSQMKDEFLATLSHELRTPLTAILGWAQVLRRGSRDAADLQRGLQTIERNARAQAQLIEDLLDMSRITSGKVLLTMQVLSPLAVIEAAIETVRPAAEAKNIRIVRTLHSTGQVLADPSRLQQVIWNLLSNAIKFTPRNGEVRVGACDAEGQLQIVIADSGIGIGPEFLAHVFERFRQADSTTTRHHGGLGLGLSIVKHLVEQHGGTVAAASPGQGKGSVFTVSLPLTSGQSGKAPPARQQAPLPPAAAPDSCMRDLRGMRVLVVDDEVDARELVQRILSDCHASVQTAANAAEALSLVRSAQFDLVISDIGMPDVDGFQLLQQIRALGAARGGAVPAIALTAFARSEDRLRALEAGFSDHVAKPVEPAELIATVALAAKKRQ